MKEVVFCPYTNQNDTIKRLCAALECDVKNKAKKEHSNSLTSVNVNKCEDISRKYGAEF